MNTKIQFTLNGKSMSREVQTHRLLLDLLRDEIGMTGTKERNGVLICWGYSISRHNLTARLYTNGPCGGGGYTTDHTITSEEGIVGKGWIDAELDHKMVLRHDDPLVGPLRHPRTRSRRRTRLAGVAPADAGR